MRQLRFFLILFIFLIISCSKNEDVVDEIVLDSLLFENNDWLLADEVFELLNQHRESNNLSPINMDKSLASLLAYNHSNYMILQGKMSHDNYGIRSNKLKTSGAKSVGEIVAFGYDQASEVVSAWVNSISHKRVIEGNYKHAGFGILKSDRGKIFFTILFYR